MGQQHTQCDDEQHSLFLSPLFCLSVYCSQFERVAQSRELLLSLLTPSLLGDRLAAELTLLHLLSSVYGRTDMLALGKFSLNLTHCPSASSPPSLPLAPSSPPSLPLAPSLHRVLTQLLSQVCVCACVYVWEWVGVGV